MEFLPLYTAAGFYENELKSNILSFWLPQCVDREYGGYVNCFSNDGSTLVSHDKYTWSQGRFVWCFSRLAATDAPIFRAEERAKFLELARHGAAFLMQHCLMGEEDWRCVFLMERDGTPKEVEAGMPLDMIETAETFFKNNCAIQKTAEAMNVHKNTLLYRFKRLKELCGLDPQNFQDAIVLQLLFLAGKLYPGLLKQVIDPEA